jgi:hypothetical protein
MRVINNLEKGQTVSEDECTNVLVNYAFSVNNTGVQWNVMEIILMVLTIFFIVVKGTLQFHGKSIFYDNFFFNVERDRSLTTKIRSWQTFIKKQEWRRQLGALKNYKGEKEIMNEIMEGREDKKKSKEHISEFRQYFEQK